MWLYRNTIFYTLIATTERIYIAIHVKAVSIHILPQSQTCSQSIHRLWSHCLECSCVGFCVASYWYWLHGCKWLSLCCIATEVVVSQAEGNVFPLSIFEGEKAREVFGKEPCKQHPLWRWRDWGSLQHVQARNFEVVLDLCFLWTTLSHIVDINNVAGVKKCP